MAHVFCVLLKIACEIRRPFRKSPNLTPFSCCTAPMERTARLAGTGAGQWGDEESEWEDRDTDDDMAPQLDQYSVALASGELYVAARDHLFVMIRHLPHARLIVKPTALQPRSFTYYVDVMPPDDHILSSLSKNAAGARPHGGRDQERSHCAMPEAVRIPKTSYQ